MLKLLKILAIPAAIGLAAGPAAASAIGHADNSRAQLRHHRAVRVAAAPLRLTADSRSRLAQAGGDDLSGEPRLYRASALVANDAPRLSFDMPVGTGTVASFGLRHDQAATVIHPHDFDTSASVNPANSAPGLFGLGVTYTFR